jgi:peptide-methionine (R)-S-oxide reductase
MKFNWTTILELAEKGNLPPTRRVEKTPAQWADQLSPEAYQVTRAHGTERPFSSDMCHRIEPGLYHCVCCDSPLFDGSEKFDSGTGWPSFTHPIEANAIAYKADHSYGMTRIEALCNTCDAHLGHVFPDGPQPTGLRYCMNAVAMVKQTK